MDRLLDLQYKLQKTGAALGKLESELPRHRHSLSLQSNILSLKNLSQKLETDFQDAADQIGMDVYRYRLLDDRPPARALGRIIGYFQDAFSLAYDALRHGAKERRNISTEAQMATELRIAYTLSGSREVHQRMKPTEPLRPGTHIEGLGTVLSDKRTLIHERDLALLQGKPWPHSPLDEGALVEYGEVVIKRDDDH